MTILPSWLYSTFELDSRNNKVRSPVKLFDGPSLAAAKYVAIFIGLGGRFCTIGLSRLNL